MIPGRHLFRFHHHDGVLSCMPPEKHFERVGIESGGLSAALVLGGNPPVHLENDRPVFYQPGATLDHDAAQVCIGITFFDKDGEAGVPAQIGDPLRLGEGSKRDAISTHHVPQGREMRVAVGTESGDLQLATGGEDSLICSADIEMSLRTMVEA